MEDGAKEDPAQHKVPKFLGKAGWVKKAPGRLLASYKDRYVHVEKTEIVVYENEDLQNCLERLDLENYDECHELKSPFKKKHRLILIRSPKSGNKVHDVKFQAQTAEEKDSWIKALSDGINRAKNKVLDEVMIDESSNLEHVTRTRPKGNRNRRPPTRIHMKEVAVVSSDGILRLDLDLEDAIMPNGTHHASDDGTETLKEAITIPASQTDTSEAAEKQLLLISQEEAQAEPEVSPQKKVIKPPMPPTKEAKSSSAPEDEPDKDDGAEKKVLKPPMPPSKEAKPCVSPVEEAADKAKPENASEMSPDTSKKTGPPPTPPNKPSTSSSMSNHAETAPSRPNSGHPPTPPLKEKKPSHPAVKLDQQVQGTADEQEKEEDSRKEITETAVETDEADHSVSKEVLLCVSDDELESPTAGRKVSKEKLGDTISSGMKKTSDNEPQIPTEPLRKNLSPLLTAEEKPEELSQPDRQHRENCSATSQPNEGPDSSASDTSASSLQAEEALQSSEVPSVIVSLNDPPTDSLSLSPLLCHLPGEKKKKAEEKSVDSGQHSDDESEGSGSEDTLAASTAALRGSHAGLDVLDTSEDDMQISVNLRLAQPVTKPQVRPKVFPSKPIVPLKSSNKARSASIGDLLSDAVTCIQVKEPSRPGAGSARVPGDDVMKLETQVALEIEKTSKLLSRVSKVQEGGDGEDMPEDLLAKAMEKLKKADHVLREVKKLKLANDSSNRKSW